MSRKEPRMSIKFIKNEIKLFLYFELTRSPSKKFTQSSVSISTIQKESSFTPPKNTVHRTQTKHSFLQGETNATIKKIFAFIKKQPIRCDAREHNQNPHIQVPSSRHGKARFSRDQRTHVWLQRNSHSHPTQDRLKALLG